MYNLTPFESPTYRPEDGVLTAIATGPSAGSTALQNLSFSFDGLGNLISRSDGTHTETFGYDNLNRLTSSSISGTIAYLGNGNIYSKTDVSGNGSGTYAYDSTHPHAVASAFGYSMTYDANGNLATRSKGTESWNIRYAGFDKPRWMTKTSGSTVAGSEFLYNAGRSRVMQLEYDHVNGSQAPDHYVRKRVYAMGATLEVNYSNTVPLGSAPSWTLQKVRIYVPGPDGVVGAREFNPNGPVGFQETALVYHYDHLGSIERITPYGSTSTTCAADGTGKSGRFAEDPWGQRRNPLTWSGPPTTTDDGGSDSLTPRGFTGHEMLDDLGLVHMNGRIYDPLLGRFLSADLGVQFPGDLQSYNRYSYVRNNPLSVTDPTGFDEPAMEETKKKIDKEQEQRARIADAVNKARSMIIGSRGPLDYVVRQDAADRAISQIAAILEKTPSLDKLSYESPLATHNDTVPKSPLADPSNWHVHIDPSQRRGYQFERDASPEFRRRALQVLANSRNMRNKYGDLTQAALVQRQVEHRGWDSVVLIRGSLGNPSWKTHAETGPWAFNGGDAFKMRDSGEPGLGSVVTFTNLAGRGAEAAWANEVGHVAQNATGGFAGGDNDFNEFEPTRLQNEVFEATGLQRYETDSVRGRIIRGNIFDEKSDWNKYIPWVPVGAAPNHF